MGELGDSLVCFFDDDVRIAPGTLRAYARAAAGVESGQLYGGPLGVDYELPPPDWLLPYLPASALGWSLGTPATPDGIRPFFGANWAAFVCDIRKCGPFCTRLGPSERNWAMGEEADMQRRLRALGVRPVYVPDALVWHWVPAERCTPRWALRRAYRAGVAGVLQEWHQWPTLFGFPRWMIKPALGRLARFLVSRLSRDQKTRFLAARDYLHWLGMMQGYRLARRLRKS